MIHSVGTLYAIQDLCDDLSARQIVASEFLTMSRYSTSTAKDVVRTATDLGWIFTDEDGCLRRTPIGVAANSGTGRANRLRSQLESVVGQFRPPWAAVLINGRAEAARSLPPEVKQCFSEAQLLTTTDDDVVESWARLQEHMWDERQRLLREIGRRGERLTLDYEERRTGDNPKWTGFESRFAGYDVLSVISSSEPQHLKIEVKASTHRFRDAQFQITENEWKTATVKPDQYYFHVWLINCENLLFVLRFTDIAAHVPANRGAGSWKNTAIPISAVTNASKAVSVAGARS